MVGPDGAIAGAVIDPSNDAFQRLDDEWFFVPDGPLPPDAEIDVQITGEFGGQSWSYVGGFVTRPSNRTP